MKYRHISHALGLLLAVFMVCSICVSAFAMTAEDIDFDRFGSVTVEMKNASDEAITTGELTLRQVATLKKLSNGDAEYSVADGFADCDVDGLSEAQVAETLDEWANSHNISGTTHAVDSTGTVAFSDLSLGVYLVSQTGASEGYNSVNPFLVTVPEEENGAVIYDVNATPKMSSITAVPSEPVVSEPKTSEPVVSEPNVSNPVVSDNPTVTANPVVSSEPDNGGKLSGTDGAKTGDIVMWSAVGVAVIACAIGGITAVTKRKRGDINE